MISNQAIVVVIIVGLLLSRDPGQIDLPTTTPTRHIGENLIVCRVQLRLGENVTSHTRVSERHAIGADSDNVTKHLPRTGLNNVTLNDDDDTGDDLTFDEKKREDGYNRTTPEEHPYSVLLAIELSTGGEGVCTGSLLTEVWVLTAAHCVENAVRVNIYAGGASLEELKSNRLRNGSQLQSSTVFILHPKYHTNSKNYDVAVIKTSEKFNLTITVNTMELSVQPWTYKSYKECTFTGFGMVHYGQTHSEDKTRKTHQLNMKRPCLCSFRLRMMQGRSNAATFLCSQPLEDYGVCPGDSGGGLICDGKLRGVAMQAVNLLNVRTCEMAMLDCGIRCGGCNTLSIFQNTCYFVRWIKSQVRLYNESLISPRCQEPKGGARLVLPHLRLVLILILASFHPLCTNLAEGYLGHISDLLTT